MSNEIQFLLYNLPDKEGRVQVVIKDETIWCTQKAMAELFGIDKSGISRHIANIFKEEELQQLATEFLLPKQPSSANGLPRFSMSTSKRDLYLTMSA